MPIMPGWRVEAASAETARRIALEAGILNHEFHPTTLDDFVIWPLRESVTVGFGELVENDFNRREPLDPHSRLEQELLGVELPRRWEILEDLVLLPEESLLDGDSDTWMGVCRALKVRRVARQAEVDPGPMRQSRAELLHGSHGWVNHLENGVRYVFDATRVMFSSGNITERRRMGEIDAAGDVIVDLFAGIGYYTIPLLARAGASVVQACEMNPDSIEGLTKGLAANMVLDRCRIHQGDNRETAATLMGIADRVLLGLLPSSEYAWQMAFDCLKPEGGILHVHMNAEQSGLDDGSFVGGVADKFTQMGSQVEVLHLEDVKSYAPHVRHVVIDVSIRKL